MDRRVFRQVFYRRDSISQGSEVLSGRASDMTSLSRDEKALLFDCCLGLAGAERGLQAITLLAHKEKATDLHARIRAVLRPLESVCRQPCPTELAESTVQRLCAAAQGICPIARSDVAGFSLRRSEDLPRHAGEAAIGEPATKGIDGSIRF